MYVFLVNKDGSHINKSDIPLLSAFLDLIKQFHDILKQVWFDATFDFSNPWFFEPSSISLGGSKNRNSTVLLNQNLSVLIDGLHNERQNLCLDVRIIYSFEMTIHWETEYCI